MTAPGIRSGYDDAISKYQEARGNYDTGLVAAQKMAVAIGGMRGYDGYTGFSLMSLEDGSLDHQIEQRPVINETMSVVEKADYTLRGMQQNAPKAYYLSIGISDEDAETYVESAQTQQNSFLMSPFQQATTTPQVDDPNATPEDAFDSRQNSGVNESDIIRADELLSEAV